MQDCLCEKRTKITKNDLKRTKQHLLTVFIALDKTIYLQNNSGLGLRLLSSKISYKNFLPKFIILFVQVINVRLI